MTTATLEAPRKTKPKPKAAAKAPAPKPKPKVFDRKLLKVCYDRFRKAERNHGEEIGRGQIVRMSLKIYEEYGFLLHELMAAKGITHDDLQDEVEEAPYNPELTER